MPEQAPKNPEAGSDYFFKVHAANQLPGGQPEVMGPGHVPPEERGRLVGLTLPVQYIEGENSEWVVVAPRDIATALKDRNEGVDVFSAFFWKGYGASHQVYMESACDPEHKAFVRFRAEQGMLNGIAPPDEDHSH